MEKSNNIVVGLDIGTTKVCAIVAEVKRDSLEIIGVGSSNSAGLKNGVVVNIENTVGSITKAVEEAELMAGYQIQEAVIGIAGSHIRGFNSRGIVAVKSREVTQQDVDRVISAAKTIAIPLDNEVIHVIPQEFIVDDQDDIKYPIGMSGLRLEARVHIVTASSIAAQNIVKCANKAGLDVSDIILEQIASSEAVLTEDEKELGVALIDIGGGTTDVAIFSGGTIIHTFVIPKGGQSITSDVSLGTKTVPLDAEKIKIKFGIAKESLARKDEIIEIPGFGGRPPRSISRQVLGNIVEQRMGEIFTWIRKNIEKNGLESKILSGYVITGGAALIEGCSELAGDIFNAPVRIGLPLDVGGLTDVISSPVYSTGVGLVKYAFKNNKNKEPLFKRGGKNVFESIKDRLLKLLEEFF
ncbi:MAG: cell division protein FtsA [Deltaproteobacteria bacterium]|nr:cell division protein FtsA [Deltaproteobacteria bacterium]